MAEWRFGTVIDNRVTTIMLIGVSDGRYRTTDHYGQHVPAGEWYGMTLADKGVTEPDPGPYGEPGDTTWVLNSAPSSREDWTVLDE